MNDFKLAFPELSDSDCEKLEEIVRIHIRIGFGDTTLDIIRGIRRFYGLQSR